MTLKQGRVESYLTIIPVLNNWLIVSSILCWIYQFLLLEIAPFVGIMNCMSFSHYC